MRKKRNNPIQGPEREHAFERMAERIRARIEDGEWIPGAALPSIRKLAEEYGLGIAPLRMAIEKLKREQFVVSTRRRIVVCARPASAFTPERLVLVTYNDVVNRLILDPMYEALNHGIQMGISRERSPFVIAGDSDFGEHVSHAYLNLPLRGIMAVGPLSRTVLDEYEGLDLPVVIVDQNCCGRKLHSIAVNNRAAAFEVTQRLIGVGHRRIAFLRRISAAHVRDIDPDSRERQEGFTEALTAGGLPEPRSCIFNFLSRNKPQSPNIQAVLNAKPRFTAIVVVDDEAADRLLRAAHERGLRVPEDLSLVSFSPKNTALQKVSGARIDFVEMGTRAATLLAKPRHHPLNLQVKAFWVEGQTIAPPRQRDAEGFG